MQTAMSITGKYIPPGRMGGLSLGMLEILSTPSVEATTQHMAPHILVGDIDVATRTPAIRRVGHEARLWQLNDPAIPTANARSAIDRAKLIPGYYAPVDVFTAGPSRGEHWSWR